MEDLVKIKTSFIEEIELASQGKQSSLPFLITQLPESKEEIGQELFEVLVIGGSNYQQAFCQRHETLVKILSKKEGKIPTFGTKEVFLEFIAEHVDQNVQKVVINFAYPMTNEVREGSLDGILLRGTKEHIFEGLVGQKVGEEIETYMLEKFGHKITTHIANDTICLLFSGLSVGESENLACAIVGTGYNAAFFIDAHKVVNLEAANFDKFPQSESGRKIDTESTHPGGGLFEKEISGAYLFHHFRHTMEREGIQSYDVNTAEALSLVAQEEGSSGKIAQNILTRSADLVATHIAGIAEYKKRDMVFVIEGSLFWKGYKYKERVEEKVRELTSYSVEFVKIEDSGIIGAAHLI